MQASEIANDLFLVERYDYTGDREVAFVVAFDAEQAMALLKSKKSLAHYDLMQGGYKIHAIAIRLNIKPMIFFCDISHKDIY